MITPRSISLAYCLLFLFCPGCRQEPGIRQYTEVIPAPSAQPATAPAAAPFLEPGKTLPSAPASDLAWTTPEGWREQTGSGMRLVTFTMADGERKGECTIVTLGGQAGGTGANLKRWIGQLPDAEVDEAGLDAFIDGLDTFTTAGGHTGTFADLGTFVPDHHDHASMLAGIIQRGDLTVFVKLMGPKSLLKEQREAFRLLCKSIR